MTTITSEDRTKVVEVEHPQLLGTPEEPAQVSEANNRREVKCGAGDGSDRDPPLEGYVRVDEGFRAMNSNCTTPLAWHRRGHVNRNRPSGNQSQ